MSDVSGEDLDLLAKRIRATMVKRGQRARYAERDVEQQAREAVAKAPTGYQIPPMPGRSSDLRRWFREMASARWRKDISHQEWQEVRQAFTSIQDSYRAAATVRQSLAAMKAAEAQERMSEVLAAVEHGGAAMVMLSRLQEELNTGSRRPLPPRIVSALQSPSKDPA